MFKLHNPETVAEPVAAYTHGVEIGPNARLLYVSGQIPQRSDGSIPDTIEEQTEVVWSNIRAVLASAGMTVTDICKMNTYLTRPESLAPVRSVRGRHLGEHRPASTTVIVRALAWPEFLIEVEVLAARAAPAVRASPARRPAKQPAKRPAARKSKAKARARRRAGR